jgi:signal transduction histidine kinase
MLNDTSCFAQSYNFLFNHFGYKEGLSTLTTRSAVDVKNRIWITTDDGLVSFNGKNFDLIKHDYSNPKSISSNRTDKIVKNKKDELWISAGYGIEKMNAITQEFEHCFFLKGNKKQYEFHAEEMVYDSTRNIVWAITRHGLYYSKNGNVEFQKAFVNKEDSLFSTTIFNSMAIDGRGVLWFCNNEGFYEWTPEKHQIKQHDSPNATNKKAQGLFCLYIDNEQILWIGAWTRGLISYTIKTGESRQYFYSNYLKENNAVSFINQNELARKNNFIWITAEGKGFGIFNKNTKQFEFYGTKTEDDPRGIKRGANSMLELPDHTTFFTSESGLYSVSGLNEKYKCITVGKYNVALNTSPVTNFCFLSNNTKSSKKALFTIPYDKGYVYDFEKNATGAVPDILKKYYDGLHITEHYVNYVDNQNVLWISTQKFGVIAYDINSNKMLIKDNQFNMITSNVFGIYESKNTIWLCAEEGLFKVDKKTYSVTKETSINESLQQNKLSLYINDLTVDSKENIWFLLSKSESKSVVGFYNTKLKKCQFYTSQKTLLFNKINRINNIEKINDSLYYFATTDGLLEMKVHHDIASFKIISNTLNADYNNIGQIKVDNHGMVWCSCLSGLQSYKPNTSQSFVCYPFILNDIPVQKWPEIFHDSATDKLYYFSVGNIHHLNTTPVASTIKKNRLSFTKCYIMDSLAFSEEAMQTIKEINLLHDYNKISIQFAIHSFLNSAANKYAWKLEGAENVWHYSATNEAVYEHLSPGKYILMVKASDCNANWIQDPIQILIKVAQPFYYRAWFILLCLASISGITYWAVKNNYKRKLEKEKLQNRIANDLHDEIGSTLTSINILSNVSQKTIHQSPERTLEMIQQIASQSKFVQQNMSDIVWSIRADSEKIEDLIIRIKEYVAQILEPLEISLVFSINEKITNLSMSIQSRKEILLIMKEAINNIAKHSKCTEVKISFQKEAGNIVISVIDNGKWKQSNSSSGIGLKSMAKRAKDIGGKLEVIHTEQGTQICMQLPITSIG